MVTKVGIQRRIVSWPGEGLTLWYVVEVAEHDESQWDVLQTFHSRGEAVEYCHTLTAQVEAANAAALARWEAASNRWDRLAAGWCPSCEQAKNDVETQYSFGVYAGIMCGDCARMKYRDGCGLDGPQGRAADLDEPLEAD